MFGCAGRKGRSDEMAHQCCFDESWLREHLSDAGFVDIVRLPLDSPYNIHGRINLGIEAKKPVNE